MRRETKRTLAGVLLAAVFIVLLAGAGSYVIGITWGGAILRGCAAVRVVLGIIFPLTVLVFAGIAALTWAGACWALRGALRGDDDA
jgi:apolipoprotein N-acyltransferase